jgi:hypothetical protein
LNVALIRNGSTRSGTQANPAAGFLYERSFVKKVSIQNKLFLWLAALSLFCISGAANAAPSAPAIPQGPALDLKIKYYDRALTAEGVLRESHFEETMLRRPGHVWTARVLPAFATKQHAHEHHEHEERHFNPVALPRHVALNGNEIKLEFVDRSKKEVINIVASEYENVSFDGSWINAYFLVDPQQVVTMPLSAKESSVAGARWYEQEKNGVYQRVLWDEQNMIPLEVETGRRDGTMLRKVSVEIVSKTSKETPWSNVKGYIQKEYSDFLD